MIETHFDYPGHTEVIFGNGDVACGGTGFSDEKGNKIGITYYHNMDQPLVIGEIFESNPINSLSDLPAPSVSMAFYDVKSLDVVIKELQKLRNWMATEEKSQE